MPLPTVRRLVALASERADALGLPAAAADAARAARGPLRLAPAVRWLHRESAGVPRRVDQPADGLLHRDAPVLGATPALADAGPALELDR